MTPSELAEQMGRMLNGIESPPESEDNIQRLYSDRQMVQVMTIHKSKGLEAPVIILYGGFGRPLERQVNVIQDPEEGRRILVGSAARKAVAQRIQLEQRQEDQRLLYVALTRPQVKLILPLIDSSRSLQGSYQPLKERLISVYKSRQNIDRWGELFEVKEVQVDSGKAYEPTGEDLTAWSPPESLLFIPNRQAEMAAVREQHRPLMMTSYTRLKEQGSGAIFTALEEGRRGSEEVAYDPSSSEVRSTLNEGATLPGGRHVGRCLHEIIEELPFELFPNLGTKLSSKRRSQRSKTKKEGPANFEEWMNHLVVKNTFESVMRRHGVPQQWRFTCQHLIYQTLNSELLTPRDSNAPERLPALCRTKHIIEMEFLFPIPELSHPSLEESASALAAMPRGSYASHLGSQDRLPWRVERGFVKGFIDFIFEHDGLIYFADWKSDQLLTYAGHDFLAYIEDHYQLQAQLYTLGVIRWLKITTEDEYNQRFGGLFYFFLRALADQSDEGQGVYFNRPHWSEVLLYERQLSLVIDRTADDNK